MERLRIKSIDVLVCSLATAVALPQEVCRKVIFRALPARDVLRKAVGVLPVERPVYGARSGACLLRDAAKEADPESLHFQVLITAKS